MSTALSVHDLTVGFRQGDRELRAVDGVSFSLRQGEILAIVGESGSGKSVTALTLLGLTRQAGATHAGDVLYDGINLVTASERELRRVRGAEIAMIFQDPLTSLNPLQRIGTQIVEMLRLHTDLSRSAAAGRAVELLAEVGIPRPAESAAAYPHQFSGGMRQRAMIAIAIACGPKVLIADEPTTALDVTIQAQVLGLVKRLTREQRTATILITHDLGVVADMADRVAVMYAGRIVETGECGEIFRDPQHPYTWGLLGSIPRIDRPRPRRLRSIDGVPPSLVDLPDGCSFRPRCGFAMDRCVRTPTLEPRRSREHLDACWLEIEDKEAARP